jgi:hypothetical protein
VEVLNTEVGTKVVGNVIEEGRQAFLPGVDCLVKAVLGLKIPVNALLIRVLGFHGNGLA